MSKLLSGLLGRLRQPEHTGDNRCVPCTVVNLAFATLVAGGVAVAVSSSLGVARGVAVGGGLSLAFVAVVYLRGYLLPGTPWLTRRYLPDRILDAFGKESTRTPEQPAEALAVEAFLGRADAVTECRDVDDLCLTDGFHRDWREAIARRRAAEPADGARALFGLDPARLSFESDGDAFVVRIRGRRPRRWPSRAAFDADAAAAEVLRNRTDDWATLGPEARETLLEGLRIFLERCPDCDGPVALGDEVVESCCRSVEVVAMTCEDCGARLVETEHPG